VLGRCAGKVPLGWCRWGGAAGVVPETCWGGAVPVRTTNCMKRANGRCRTGGARTGGARDLLRTGPGGLPQLFVEDYQNVLRPIDTIPLPP
jgi:hypothetical protein